MSSEASLYIFLLQNRKIYDILVTFSETESLILSSSSHSFIRNIHSGSFFLSSCSYSLAWMIFVHLKEFKGFMAMEGAMKLLHGGQKYTVVRGFSLIKHGNSIVFQVYIF